MYLLKQIESSPLHGLLQEKGFSQYTKNKKEEYHHKASASKLLNILSSISDQSRYGKTVSYYLDKTGKICLETTSNKTGKSIKRITFNPEKKEFIESILDITITEAPTPFPKGWQKTFNKQVEKLDCSPITEPSTSDLTYDDEGKHYDFYTTSAHFFILGLQHIIFVLQDTDEYNWSDELEHGDNGGIYTELDYHEKDNQFSLNFYGFNDEDYERSIYSFNLNIDSDLGKMVSKLMHKQSKVDNKALLEILNPLIRKLKIEFVLTH